MSCRKYLYGRDDIFISFEFRADICSFCRHCFMPPTFKCQFIPSFTCASSAYFLDLCLCWVLLYLQSLGMSGMWDWHYRVPEGDVDQAGMSELWLCQSCPHLKALHVLRLPQSSPWGLLSSTVWSRAASSLHVREHQVLWVLPVLWQDWSICHQSLLRSCIAINYPYFLTFLY